MLYHADEQVESLVNVKMTKKGLVKTGGQPISEWEDTCPDCLREAEEKMSEKSQNRQCAENWQTLPYSSDHLWRADHHQLPSGACTKCGKLYEAWHQQLTQTMDEPQSSIQSKDPNTVNPHAHMVIADALTQAEEKPMSHTYLGKGKAPKTATGCSCHLACALHQAAPVLVEATRQAMNDITWVLQTVHQTHHHENGQDKLLWPQCPKQVCKGSVETVRILQHALATAEGRT